MSVTAACHLVMTPDEQQRNTLVCETCSLQAQQRAFKRSDKLYLA